MPSLYQHQQTNSPFSAYLTQVVIHWEEMGHSCFHFLLHIQRYLTVCSKCTGITIGGLCHWKANCFYLPVFPGSSKSRCCGFSASDIMLRSLKEAIRSLRQKEPLAHPHCGIRVDKWDMDYGRKQLPSMTPFWADTCLWRYSSWRAEKNGSSGVDF